jgi:hypothetical protein
MTIEADLNIAEIPYGSGAIRFRYARVMSPDKTRWIRHGLFVEYHENGTVVSEGQYVDGKEDGLWRDFHPNGQPASEGRYREGQEVGVWRFWSPTESKNRAQISTCDGPHSDVGAAATRGAQPTCFNSLRIKAF